MDPMDSQLSVSAERKQLMKQSFAEAALNSCIVTGKLKSLRQDVVSLVMEQAKQIAWKLQGEWRPRQFSDWQQQKPDVAFLQASAKLTSRQQLVIWWMHGRDALTGKREKALQT
eukprot:TRINITY_DN96044_c0_g1_i1.p1 TRINITY_DN96044_c0_g1~~TRINITY_DN96044_c0_g1_i1.p1  ORF type:complete len:114 (+),score=17.15 TRINITY_DN96044_c0_g1_i1:285-626(+)